MKDAVVKSWQTTLAGVGQFMGVAGTAIHAHFDGDPTTVVAWGLLASSFAVMIGLITARDNSVSSETAGVK